jgi:hypothetical protein
MEKIYVIEEGYFKKDDREFEGFLISTNKQIIKLGITPDKQCCENFGYFMSEDDLKQFIGSEIISIQITDDALKTYDFTENMEDEDVMFVDFKTTSGVLQFVAYNSHNGYYGHDACVVSEQIEFKCNL